MTQRAEIQGAGDQRRATTTGIPHLRAGEVYAPLRPNGRRGSYVFHSPFRAAEHAMQAFGVDHWSVLQKQGWTVCIVQM